MLNFGVCESREYFDHLINIFSQAFNYILWKCAGVFLH